MAGKELKRFTRKELLEILVSQGKEIERLREELRIANEKLDSREICINNSGSIAEAALNLNHVFEDADTAVQQYIASIKRMNQLEREKLNEIEKKEQELKQILEAVKEQQGISINSHSLSFEREDRDEA